MMDLVNNKISDNVTIQSVYSFLNKTEFIPSNFQNKNKLKDLLDNQSFEIFELFEFNKNITLAEASIKYDNLLKSINDYFNTKFKLNEIYSHYIKYTGVSFPVNRFLNFLQILNYIIQNFGDIFIINNNNLLKTISKTKIEILEIEQSQISSLNKKLILLFKKIEEDTSNNINLIILIFLISLGNIVDLDNDGIEFNDLMTYISIYNKIYTSNIYISFIFYIDMNILINMYATCLSRAKSIGRNKHDNQDLGNKINETVVGNIIGKIGRNKKINDDANWKSFAGVRIDEFAGKNNFNLLENINAIIPNLYLYDCENSNFPENEKFKIIIFQNYLQVYVLYILSKKKIKFSANLTFDNINEFDINYFKEINENYYNKINVKNFRLITEENINIIFQNLSFTDLIIKISNSDNQNYIRIICNTFSHQISKSVYFYMQEFLSVSKSKNKNELSDNNISLNNILTEFDILFNLVSFLVKIKEGRSFPQHIILKFHIFKCTINVAKKEIQIYFNYSKVKERILLQYLISSSNIVEFSKLYIKALKNLCNFKNYKITVRISQTNFRSSQLNFCFCLLTKKIYDFFEEQKDYKIIIAESKMPNFNPNMQIYIKDIKNKKRLQIAHIKKIINNYNNKLKALYDYLDTLFDNFDVIIISDNEKEFKALNTIEENKLFIYITNDIADNNNMSNRNQNIKNDIDLKKSYNFTDKKQKNKINNILDNTMFNIILQLRNNSSSFDNCLTFIYSILSENCLDFPYKTTLICDRFFLEGNVLVEPSMKQCANIIYRYMDNFFLLAKNNKEEDDRFNYYVYMSSKFIIVENNHIYDKKSDIKYVTAINQFLSVISSCIELIIYIMRYKNVEVEKFMYIIRTKNENHFVLEFKNSNIIVRKLKKYCLPLNFNLKESEPFFCLLSSKQNSEFTIDTNDFYNIFLRLFLNLNKITNDKKGDVNQEFLQKIHKTLFHQYYDAFSVVAFNYESFNFFNSFLVDNDYLSITKNEKFTECYFFILSNLLNKKDYEFFIQSQNNSNNLIAKNISIVNFHLNQSFKINNANILRFGFRKTEYFVKEWKNYVIKNNKQEINLKIKYLIQKMKMKNMPKKKVIFALQNIKKFFIQEGIVKYFDSNSNYFNKIVENYKVEKTHIKVQNVEERILQLTQEAKDNLKNQNNETKRKKKDCIIF